MPTQGNIAAVVAAYNEAQTIGQVVKTLVQSGFFREVIVISDGSSDRTAEIAKEAGADMVHNLPWKHGKGAAILHGVAHTDAPLLFFCDADLRGLTVEHIGRVLEPVLSGRLAMCVGLRDRGKLMMKIAHHLPLIGGERALRRNIFEAIPDKYLQGFMLETSLNYYCRMQKLPYGTVELKGLHIRRKMQKVGFVRGLCEYIGMAYQVLRAAIIIRQARWRNELR